jgi:hypothetical protein
MLRFALSKRLAPFSQFHVDAHDAGATPKITEIPQASNSWLFRGRSKGPPLQRLLKLAASSPLPPFPSRRSDAIWKGGALGRIKFLGQEGDFLSRRSCCRRNTKKNGNPKVGCSWLYLGRVQRPAPTLRFASQRVLLVFPEQTEGEWRAGSEHKKTPPIILSEAHIRLQPLNILLPPAACRLPRPPRR